MLKLVDAEIIGTTDFSVRFNPQIRRQAAKCKLQKLYVHNRDWGYTVVYLICQSSDLVLVFFLLSVYFTFYFVCISCTIYNNNDNNNNNTGIYTELYSP